MPRHSPIPVPHARSARLLALCLTVGATHAVAPAALRAQPPAAAPGPARDTATPPRGVRERGLQVGRGEWAVDAVLTVPAGTAPAPAVVLMHGSGGGTKDGDVGPNKVYREMAWALGARGVAVLRYDKRLTAHAARARALGRPLTMDEDQTDDGVAAARLLQHTEGVDPRRVHVLAVSQSTAVAADVAARVAQAGGPPLAGLVLVSASARGPAQMIREQTAYGARVARQRGDSAGLREALAVQAEAERMARPTSPTAPACWGWTSATGARWTRGAPGARRRPSSPRAAACSSPRARATSRPPPGTSRRGGGRWRRTRGRPSAATRTSTTSCSRASAR
jgi:hypothetical protein